jgi:hypothetical protein
MHTYGTPVLHVIFHGGVGSIKDMCDTDKKKEL